jgi:hypothetical protein
VRRTTRTDWRHFHVPDAIGLATVTGSLALFFYSPKAGRDPKFILDLGLGYRVLISLAIALLKHWAHVPGF